MTLETAITTEFILRGVFLAVAFGFLLGIIFMRLVDRR